MKIEPSADVNQSDTGDRTNMAICPACGQKLFEVESIFRRGVFRMKCRRCKKYIRVEIVDNAG